MVLTIDLKMVDKSACVPCHMKVILTTYLTMMIEHDINHLLDKDIL